MARILFGLISLLFILSFVKMPYLYSKGLDTPPFSHWITYFGLPIFGLIFTLINGNIRTRLHKIWTPIGLLILFLSIGVFAVVDYPASQGIVDAIINFSSESFIYTLALGFLLAFVDLSAFGKYAYCFTPLALFGIAFFVPSVIQHLMMLLHFFGISVNSAPEFDWDIFLDFVWYCSGFFFAYLVVKKLKTDKPNWKKVLLSIGIFIASWFVITVSSQALGGVVSKDSWTSHWLKGDKPVITDRVVCVGNNCGKGIFVSPYENMNVVFLTQLFRPAGLYPFQLIAQDHSLTSCKFKINSDTSMMMATCPNKISHTDVTEMSFRVQSSDVQTDVQRAIIDTATSDFASCSKKYQVLNTSPQTCKTPDGRSFSNSK